MLDNKGIRQLCYAVKVTNITPINGADRVELAHVNGWQVMVKKGEYKIGDLAIYFEIDSKLPETEPFEFMAKYKYRVKTQKFIKGSVLSQGLIMTPAELGLKDVKEGDFLTDKLGVTYYEAEDNIRKADNKKLAGLKADKFMEKWAKKHKFLFRFAFIRKWRRKKFLKKYFAKQKKTKSGGFPNQFPYIHKSDEERIENMPEILKDKEPWIKTLKIDGTSSTYILERIKGNKKFEFYVVSRNVRQETPDQKCYHESNVYWDMAFKYHIEDFLKEQLILHPEWKYVCIQGETAGVGVQGNPHKLKDTQFFGFNFIDSEKGRWNSVEAKNYVAKWNIQWVPIIDEHYILPDTLEEMKATADGQCELEGASGLREGYVYRDLQGQKSFKNVSNQYLMSK